MICEKVFLGSQSGKWFFEMPGLLTSKHLHRKLETLLQLCANPSKAIDGTRIEAGEDFRRQLIKYFKEIVDIASKLRNT